MGTKVPDGKGHWRTVLRMVTLAEMNDIDRARLKRISQPGAAGLLYFMQYAYPLAFPGERLELTPVVETIAECAANRGDDR